MITGAHSIIYSTDAEADRAFLRDVIGFPYVDAHDGWLIFGLPPSEVAVHPSEKNDLHEFYLMCDDVSAFVAEMAKNDIACGPVSEEGWGLLTSLTLPGGGQLGVYEPRHASPSSLTDQTRTMLKSQYHAALAMLRECIDECTDELWLSDEYRNRCWQVAYHVLYFTHLYLQPNEEAFQPWSKHQAEVQYPDGIPGPPDPESPLPLVAAPYSREDVREYWSLCDGMVDAAVDALDLASSESGFSWYPVPKLEHQMINLRHIQHHVAQLADRLRSTLDVGIDWVGARRRSE